jgi:apolipoprotein N-acyltransferase
MPLLLASLAGLCWLIFLIVAAQTLFWLVFSKTVEGGKRRAAIIALVALGAAIVLSTMRFIMGFS